jgi:RimJ/RimL family protein N-acetyltransferase
MILLPIHRELEFDCSNYGEVASVMMEVIESSLAMGTVEPWCGYLALTPEKEIVGTCAFKGPPDERGEVELAWFTFPGYEGRGHGKQMASRLVALGRTHAPQAVLTAHTLPETGPSTRICEHAGFSFAGEVELPDDGPVWRWQQ